MSRLAIKVFHHNALGGLGLGLGLREGLWLLVGLGLVLGLVLLLPPL